MIGASSCTCRVTSRGLLDTFLLLLFGSSATSFALHLALEAFVGKMARSQVLAN